MFKFSCCANLTNNTFQGYLNFLFNIIFQPTVGESRIFGFPWVGIFKTGALLKWLSSSNVSKCLQTLVHKNSVFPFCLRVTRVPTWRKHQLLAGGHSLKQMVQSSIVAAEQVDPLRCISINHVTVSASYDYKDKI